MSSGNGVDPPVDDDHIASAMTMDPSKLKPLSYTWNYPMIKKEQILYANGKAGWKWWYMHCPIDPLTGKRPEFSGTHATKAAHHAAQMPRRFCV